MSQRAKTKRDSARARVRVASRKANPITCPNCGQKTPWGHFAPPSMGEDGFWACPKEATDA